MSNGDGGCSAVVPAILSSLHEVAATRESRARRACSSSLTLLRTVYLRRSTDSQDAPLFSSADERASTRSLEDAFKEKTSYKRELHTVNVGERLFDSPLASRMYAGPCADQTLLTSAS